MGESTKEVIWSQAHVGFSEKTEEEAVVAIKAG